MRDTTRENRKLEILDTTLRDGMQGRGISFSIEDKLAIVSALDRLGIDWIEAGNPFSNPKDLEFFTRAGALSLRHATLVAFGSTRKPGSRAEEDPGVQALLRSGAGAVSIVGKAWDLHVTDVLRCPLEENLAMIEETVRSFVRHGRTVMFDAEHFFDGYKANPRYALEALRAAERAGASLCTLCDTNGGCFPDEIARMVAEIAKLLTIPVGIHCHGDIGCAEANTYLAVEAGARHVQGTYLGFGERCGNAALSTVIPALQIKRGWRCIPEEALRQITPTAHLIADISNITLPDNLPFVGRSAFAHKGGMHVDGVSKNHITFEHIDPAQVGNHRAFLVSEVSGRSAILSRLREIDPTLTKESPPTIQIVDALKELERKGFQFESASASFELLVRRMLGRFTPYFSLDHYRIIQQREGMSDNSSAAMIKVKVGDRTRITAAESEDGPVHALDLALRRALEAFYPALSNVRLSDFKVRVIDSKQATAAAVRVLIDSTDGKRIWTTVGASPDIISASWMALEDSMQYKLMIDAAEARPIPPED